MCAMWFLNSALASFIIPRHGSHKVAPQVYLYYWYLFHCLILLCCKYKDKSQKYCKIIVKTTIKLYS